MILVVGAVQFAALAGSAHAAGVTSISPRSGTTFSDKGSGVAVTLKWKVDLSGCDPLINTITMWDLKLNGKLTVVTAQPDVGKGQELFANGGNAQAMLRAGFNPDRSTATYEWRPRLVCTRMGEGSTYYEGSWNTFKVAAAGSSHPGTQTGGKKTKPKRKRPPSRPKRHPRDCQGPSPLHTRLMREPWRTDASVERALNAANATFQSNREEAPNAFAFDEFSITIDEMPPGMTPEQLLAEFARDPNATVDDQVFDVLTQFRRRGTDEPHVGTIYDIDIPEPDFSYGGSVMLVERSADHFIVQTIVTKEKGRHPVSGARWFGFTRNADGSVTFATRGADRPDHESQRAAGRVAQNVAWHAMMTGLANRISAAGGKVRTRPRIGGDQAPPGGPPPIVVDQWRKDQRTGC